MMEFVNWDDSTFPIFLGKIKLMATSYHQPAMWWPYDTWVHTDGSKTRPRDSRGVDWKHDTCVRNHTSPTIISMVGQRGFAFHGIMLTKTVPMIWGCLEHGWESTGFKPLFPMNSANLCVTHNLPPYWLVVFRHPLKNDGLRQLGWLFPMENMFQTTNEHSIRPFLVIPHEIRQFHLSLKQCGAGQVHFPYIPWVSQLLPIDGSVCMPY